MEEEVLDILSSNLVTDINDYLIFKSQIEKELLVLLIKYPKKPQLLDEVILVIEMLNNSEPTITGLLLTKLQAIFSFIVESTSVFRPYEQNMVTNNGSNRVTWENISSKFPSSIFEEYFRFQFKDIHLLINLLGIPDTVNYKGHVCSSLEAILILLRRLSSQCRYSDFCVEFDLLPQFLSFIFNGLCLFLFKKIGPHIRRFNHKWLVNREKLEYWSTKLEEKGCPLNNCVGWADGTHVPVCKPSIGQRSFYDGHHKTHCFKLLVITFPSGLVLSYGPFEGSTHDSRAADIVGLDILASENFTFPDGTYFTLFLDLGYRLGQCVITPFRNRRNLSVEEQHWNRTMSRQRIAVEWSIGRIKTLFKLLNNKSQLKVLMSPVATYWFIACHLTNLHGIFYGNELSKYFDVDVEKLEDYIAEFS